MRNRNDTLAIEKQAILPGIQSNSRAFVIFATILKAADEGNSNHVDPNNLNNPPGPIRSPLSAPLQALQGCRYWRMADGTAADLPHLTSFQGGS
jgi:hypothetical protein